MVLSIFIRNDILLIKTNETSKYYAIAGSKMAVITQTMCYHFLDTFLVFDI